MSPKPSAITGRKPHSTDPSLPWSLLLISVILLSILSGCLIPTDHHPSAGTTGECPRPEQNEDVESTERLSMDLAATGPYRVGVPLPVTEPETRAETWWNATVSTQEATWRLLETPQGTVLEVEGTNSTTLCARMEHSDLKETYLDARWTTNEDDVRPDHLPVLVEEGSIELEITYKAGSQYCSRSALFEGEATAPGWHDLTGGDQANCV